MSQALSSLLSILQLERIEKNLFRGESQDIGLRQVFGGQVIGQSLSAALQTLSPEQQRMAHSFHSFFLLPGDSSKPIIYDVENLRDGKSFSARRVTAIQDGKALFYMTASFQKQENGMEFQQPMPIVTPPDTLLNENEHLSKIVTDLPGKTQALFLREKAIEMRPVKFYSPLGYEKSEPINDVWLKSNGNVPSDEKTHQFLLSYASDYTLLPTALQPHGLGLLQPEVQIATINHAMWFHRPFNIQEWLLYHCQCLSTSGSRALVQGQFFTQDGTLVASTMQEGVIRNHGTN